MGDTHGGNGGPDRGRALALVWGAYGVAGLVAVAAGFAVRDSSPLLIGLVADVAATLAIFGFSRVYRNSSFYDAYWSVAPIALAFYWASVPEAADSDPTRRMIVFALVTLWGVRLTWNWARGWTGLDHEDWRYVDLREKSGRAFFWVDLFGIHLFPTALVFVGCLAIHVSLTVDGRPFGWIDLLATVVTAGAIAIETLADAQMRDFAATKQPGQIMDRGLWAWCRHPNYLGELSFWWGMWGFAVAAAPGLWWTFAGPLVMTLLFAFVSIPMMDERSVARRPGYAEHMRRVPALIPRRPRR